MIFIPFSIWQFYHSGKNVFIFSLMSEALH